MNARNENPVIVDLNSIYMGVKKILVIISIFTITQGCKEELKRVPLADGKYETSVTINDSITLTRTYYPNERLFAKDFQNVKSNIHSIYYFNKDRKLESHFIGNETTYADIRYFDNQGKFDFRKLLNPKGEVLAQFYRDDKTGWKYQEFYSEYSKQLRSKIVFYKNGKVNKEQSSFLSIKKNGDILILNPSWHDGIHKKAIVEVYQINGTENIILKTLTFNDVKDLFVDLSDIDCTKSISIAVFAQKGVINGMPNLISSSFLIDDFENIPSNNLFPVIVNDGNLRSGRYLLFLQDKIKL